MDFSNYFPQHSQSFPNRTKEPHCIYEACVIALTTCPETSWKPEVVGDYSHHRLLFENIEEQLLGYLYKSEVKIMVMFMHWASTGKWPRFRNAPVFFTRRILEHYVGKFKDSPQRPNFPDAPPPWGPKDIAAFLEEVVSGWMRFSGKQWLRELAREKYRFQKQYSDLLEEQ